MLKLDEFESVFKSAAKERFEFSVVPIRRVAVFTDLGPDEARLFGRDAAEFLSCLGEIELETVSGDRFGDVGSLLDVVEGLRPDLIVSYRNLHGRARNFPFSLGSHIDVLTQATSTPVMLLPAPTPEGRLDASCRHIERVMVLTDHLTGSARLVNYGLAMTPRGGTLVLAHLEDDTIFKRYVDVISKIPSIDTSDAESGIKRQLLKEPHDYISSCREELLGQSQLDLQVLEEVRMGHHVADCRELVSTHSVELIVMNTKDDEQLAMHGLAYPLAVELRDVPLLLL
ncbi:MAG: hypothetical protein H6718_01495 [Polyangiaceae bacterium]|nr:hypothetical protein [Myxococcales bacterium]MCB9584037.1 hypothetical protein [Polyangiaceae bacterium]